MGMIGCHGNRDLSSEVAGIAWTPVVVCCADARGDSVGKEGKPRLGSFIVHSIERSIEDER